MDDNTRNRLIICFIVFLILLVAGISYKLYNDARTGNDSQHIEDRLDETEESLHRTGNGLADAQGKIGTTEKQLIRAESEASGIADRSRELAETAGRNQRIIDESSDIIGRSAERAAEIRRIISETESRNQKDGTQTDGAPETT